MLEIYLYDEIGPDHWGLVSAKSFIETLASVSEDEDITLRINSPGGEVNEAMAMYNALVRHRGHVTVEIDALAASAASVVAMAGDQIRIAENAVMMIHNAYTIAVGDAEQLRKVATTLDKYTDNIVGIYAKRTGQPDRQIRRMMDEETWLVADEALELGFADDLGDALKVAACIRPGQYKKQPSFAATWQGPRGLSVQHAANLIRIRQKRQPR